MTDLALCRNTGICLVEGRGEGAGPGTPPVKDRGRAARCGREEAGQGAGSRVKGVLTPPLRLGRAPSLSEALARRDSAGHRAFDSAYESSSRARSGSPTQSSTATPILLHAVAVSHSVADNERVTNLESVRYLDHPKDLVGRPVRVVGIGAASARDSPIAQYASSTQSKAQFGGIWILSTSEAPVAT
jgi:hypothetical protein